MKRQLLYLLAAFLIPSFCWGQWKQAEIPPSYRRKVPTTKIDDAQVTVYYAFNAKDIKDESTYIDLGWLQVGKQYTKYASYFVAHSDSTHQPKLIKNGAASGYAPQDFGGRYPNYWSEYQFDEIYIKDGQLTEYAFMPANLEKECCQYTETCPTQQWTLSDETKTIQGYMCQRATCHWRWGNTTLTILRHIHNSNGSWEQRHKTSWGTNARKQLAIGEVVTTRLGLHRRFPSVAAHGSSEVCPVSSLIYQTARWNTPSSWYGWNARHAPSSLTTSLISARSLATTYSSYRRKSISTG